MGDYECPYGEDLGLADDLVLYRAVYPDFVDWSTLDGEGFPVMQSRVFQEASEELAKKHGYSTPAVSIGFAHLLPSSDAGLDEFLGEDRAGWGVAKLTVGDVRSVQPRVGVLLDENGARWHGILFGLTRAKMKSEKNALRDRSILIRAPGRRAST